MVKLEKKGILTDHEEALMNILDLMDALKDKTAQQIIYTQQPEKKEESVTHPGQRIA